MRRTDAGPSFVPALRTDIDGEVRDDDGTRVAYTSDASKQPVVPACVVLPRSPEDVSQVVTRCAEAGVPRPIDSPERGGQVQQPVQQRAPNGGDPERTATDTSAR